jgi:hypothetical protein
MRLKRIEVLFYAPEYYHTFDYCDALTNSQAQCRIYVPPTYPRDLLFSEDYVIMGPSIPSATPGLLGALRRLVFAFQYLFSHIKLALVSQHIIFFVRPPITPLDALPISRTLLGRNFRVILAIFTLFRCRLYYVPSGCRDQWGRQEFSTFDDGRACNECGFRDACFETPDEYLSVSPSRFGLPELTPLTLISLHQSHQVHFEVLNRYKFKNLFNEFFPSMRLQCDFPTYKSANVNRYISASIQETRLNTVLSAGDREFRIFFRPRLGLRDQEGDLKGSRYVLDAVNKLHLLGYPIHLYPEATLPPAEVPAAMAQCDLVIDQLLYGQWGSTGVEAMLTGVPLACYVRPSWKQHYIAKYGEFPSLIETSPETLVDDLLPYVSDPKRLVEIGLGGQQFARRHYDVSINANHLLNFLRCNS